MLKTKTIFLIITLILLCGCNGKDSKGSFDKLKYYLGFDITDADSLNIYEYELMQGFSYPKSVYITFTSKRAIDIVKKLELSPSKKIIADTSFIYEYGKLYKNFWSLKSTIESVSSNKVEKDLIWWKPNLSLSVINYAGFYNEFKKSKITSSRSEKYNGRLVLQYKHNRVYIQIDLFQGEW